MRHVSWLIQGGGPHAIAALLRARRDGARDSDVMVADPLGPCGGLRRAVQNVGSQYLHSDVRESGLDPNNSGDLLRYLEDQGTNRYEEASCFCSGKVMRPKFSAWFEYADSLAASAGFGRVHVRDGVVSYDYSQRGGWTVTLSSGEQINADKVLITGAGWNNHLLPEVMRPLLGSGRYGHVLDTNWSPDQITGDRVLVIGNGMSGAQFALSRTNAGKSCLLVGQSGVGVKDSCITTDWTDLERTQWLMFERTQPGEREDYLRSNKKNGGITGTVCSALGRAKSDGSLTYSDRGVRSLELIEEGLLRKKQAVRATLGDGAVHVVDYVVVATGLSAAFGFTPVIRDMLKTDWGSKLPLSPTGHYPVLRQDLAWGADVGVEGLHVLGPYADLALGPNAAYFVGARMGVTALRRGKVFAA